MFATPDNSTIVLSIKGTSAAFIGGGGPTAKKDKFNDNLLFSCCCARVDWTWTTVCGCYRGGWKCDQNCLENALIEESLFYPIGTVSRHSTLTHVDDVLKLIDWVEFVQQFNVPIPRSQYLDDWSLPRWCACLAIRSHLRSPYPSHRSTR